MPTLEITEDQAERIREAQIAIQGRLVGKYGRVRPQDAIEYLLDQYEADDEDEELADDERDAATARIVELGDLASGATDGGLRTDNRGSPPTAPGSPTNDTGEAGSPAEDTDVDGGSGETDEEATGADESSENGEAPDSAAAMLSNTMNLLNEHADKWGEDETGEDRYAVELPDGTTERARTKDDVRALLFKHY